MAQSITKRSKSKVIYGGLLSMIFAIVIFGRLLLPGYILTLDTVFAPTFKIPQLLPGEFLNTWIYRVLIHAASLVIPTWLVEKGLIFCLLFLVPFLCYKYLFLQEESHKVRLIVASLFLLNPFVYTRFLAGHWLHLFAYALFPLVWHEASLLPSRGAGEWKRICGFGLLLALVFAFSLHLGVMALFLSAAAFFVAWPQRSSKFWRSLVIAGMVFVGAASYWTIPAFIHRDVSVITIFNEEHLLAFRPAADPHLGTVGNLLALYGFWGEREPWAQQFIWVKSWPWAWGISGAILAATILFGLIVTLREKAQRRLAFALVGVGMLALVFACGMGETSFLPINRWIFSHLGFWRGFRDSQKWIALLVFVYAYFVGAAMQWVQQLHSRVWRWVLSGSILAAILVYAFPMLFGFWGQLKPVWYPKSWDQANAILQQDPHCKAVFLPWHQYFSLKFNNNLLTASPARDFFSCELVQSREVELGGIGNQGPLDPAYDALEGVITGTDQYSPEESIQFLRDQGIRYVIFAKEIQETDPWSYSFLEASGVHKVELEGLTLYQLIQ